MGWLGECFGDSGSDVDKAAMFEQLRHAPTIFTLPDESTPAMQGRTTLGPRGLGAAVAVTGFGDIINTEGDCKAGETSMAQLLALDEQLGHPDKYQSAVAALKKSYDDAESSWSRHIPFTPVCGQIKAIGVQADTLAKQMAADHGQAPLPEGPSDQQQKGGDLVGKIVAGATTVAVIAGGVWALRELNKRRTSK